MAGEQLVWDLVDPVELITYVREYANELTRTDAQLSPYFTYLPVVTTDEIEFRIRKGDLLDVDAAVYRAWDTPAPMTGRQGTTRIEGELGPISRQIPLTEEEHIRKRILDTGNDDPLINQIYADAERMVRSVYVRLALGIGELMDSGSLSINENGLALTADFGRKAGSSKTRATVWTNAAAPALSELLEWVEDYDDENGEEPGAIVINKSIRNALMTNTEFLNYAAANGTTPSRLNIAELQGVMADNDLPPLVMLDTKVRVNGTQMRVLPKNKLFFLPPSYTQLGETRMGVTAEAMLASDLGIVDSADAAGVVAATLQNTHPVQTSVLGTAVGLPIMPNPDMVFDCTVL